MLGLDGEWKGSCACMINYRIGSYIYRNEYICLHVCGADRTPADTCADSEGGGSGPPGKSQVILVSTKK